MRKMRRLFFALWPDESIRRKIESAACVRIKPNTTPRENWHMTLVFLGPTDCAQRARLVKAATEVSATSFQMSLDVTGQFERAQVAWLGCSHPPHQLLDLQLTLEAALRNNCPDHPAFVSGAQAYRPHLTLYRHVKTAHPLNRFSPIHWPVSSFRLIESRRGQQPVYQTLNSWNLQPGS